MSFYLRLWLISLLLSSKAFNIEILCSWSSLLFRFIWAPSQEVLELSEVGSNCLLSFLRRFLLLRSILPKPIGLARPSPPVLLGFLIHPLSQLRESTLNIIGQFIFSFSGLGSSLLIQELLTYLLL